MRRIIAFAVSIFLGPLLGGVIPAAAAPAGYYEAEQTFERNLGVDQRILVQIMLISAGYGNAVPVDHFNTRVMKTIQDFEADNGFNPNGQLDKTQVDRLIAVASVKLDSWGFRKVSYPDRPIAIWVPLGLGLDVRQTASGLHYRDTRYGNGQGRLSLDLVSLPHASIVGVYNSLVAEKENDGSTIHFVFFKNAEAWFVLSTTSPDGHDHYYRYHQDGTNVTGFALEWNNAVANINAERIATIMSGSLWSAMTGAPFVDPPATDPTPPPAPQLAAVPITQPPPPSKTMVSTGTGFFVSETGHFITNAHVVADCDKIVVKADDGSVNDAERIATDTTNDLALLKIAKTPARIVTLRVGTRLGEGVEAFGFPHSDILATSGNFSLGNVTALSGMHDDSRYLQISVPVQAGNSGGPLLDTSGNLVGVVSSKLDAIKVMLADGDLPQNVNFAVKSAMVANFLDVNRVTYKVGVPGGLALQPADIADQARAVSGFVVCR